MKKTIFTVPIKDFKKRPLSFLSSFLICIVGMYVIFSMLFMQFGARQADIERAENQYHVYLDELTREHIEKIKNLSYVEDVTATPTNNSYTATIKLKNNDPYELKNQCDKIIKDIGLDKTEAYKNNLYYTQYGVLDNWINQDYYSLATSFFFTEILALLIPFIFITIIGLYISIRVKIKREIDEYGILRSFGMKISHLMKIVIFQYSLIFILASTISFVLSAITLKAVSVFTYSNFSDNFLRFGDTLRAKEALIVTVIAYVFFLIVVQGCRKLFKQDINLMLNKTHEVMISYHNRTKKIISSKSGTNTYNKLYLKRSLPQLLTDFLKTCVLFILPLFFIAFSSSVYGMKEQANTTYDYGIFFNAPHKVTEDILDLLKSNDNIERIETTHTYEDGTYGGAHIYCVNGKEEETREFVEGISNDYALLFTDNYHDSIMVINQSVVFSVFYLFQAALLFVSAISISLTDASFYYSKRIKEISIIRALGSTDKELYKLYYPDLFIKFLSFICGIIFSFAIWIKYFGIPYIKPLYIFVVLFIFTITFFVCHLLLCRRHQNKIVYGSLSEKMKEVV